MQSDRSLPERISLPEEEEKILKLWDDLDAFRRSIELSKGRPAYTFYDGPPFATGLPHYGHILAGTIKDIVTRFAHQTGHYVERRFGWDCHGLPVEYEINKKLKINSREDVMEMGIATYNAECRSIVQRYSKEWEKTVKRIGRWIDTENDYKTMEPWYMESVWNVFQTIFNKKLIYRGYKILPYSTACNTPLSNFEANMDYRDTPDPSVVVSFPLVDEPQVSLLAWTTTPWTLPSNLALCVNCNLTYVKVKDIASGKIYIVAESRVCQVYPKMDKKGYKGGEFEIESKFPGSELVGKRYVPLFDSFASWPNAFQVVEDDYVSSENGTGIVHQAPAFGEDDYRICGAKGIITKSEVPCPIDDNGRFTEEVAFVKGLHVKEADDLICKDLKQRDRLVSKNTFVHSYPFCYRSGTPLIYRAVPSWFVNVEAIKDQLVANNEQTYWVPAFVKEKRFHNWLTDAKDWAISRNRFWGTPLPLWTSEDFEEVVCVGSIEELYQLSGVRVDDLHREHIDSITIPSKTGRGVLRRVDEVFDCWFESGSMPYAQQHFPFENKEKFLNGFPADFIAEGLDQTRGWFYTLMVISTCLFDKPAFKNLIVNGLVLAEDGRKMSKSLRNFPDPNLILTQYGADALRLYLINSPVVRAEPLKFQEAGVLGVIREIFLPWYNAMRFFAQNAARLEQTTGTSFVPDIQAAKQSTNVMDSWIVAALQGLIQFFRQEMEAYRLYTVIPRLLDFIKQLTNWYVRLNRKRLKGSDGDEAARVALSALYHVLFELAKLMAPFTPFFAEYSYQFLRQFEQSGDKKEEDDRSIHFLMLPTVDPSGLNPQAEVHMQQLQSVIELGRIARERRNISLKNPIKQVIVVSSDAIMLETVRALKSYVKDELNMRELVCTSEEKEWCTLRAEPDNKLLGKRLGKAFKTMRKPINDLTHEQLMEFQQTGSIQVGAERLESNELVLKREFKGNTEFYEAIVSSDGKSLVILDCREDEALIQQGYAREVINRVQKMRKKAGLVVQDRIQVYYRIVQDEEKQLEQAMQQHQDYMTTTLSTCPLQLETKPSYAVTILGETCSIGDKTIELEIVRPCVFFNDIELKKLDVNVSDVVSYVSTMEYQTVEESLKAHNELKLQLDQTKIVLKADVHISLTSCRK